MSFITGLLLIDAPASALNNSGEKIPFARTDNTVDVKYIRTKQGDYPYVSAQAFRAWLRSSIATVNDLGSSPIYRDDKVVYTDGNPIAYWDDDLFGYMRAPGEGTRKAREVDPVYKKLTPLSARKTKKGEKEETLTRSAPFRASTLVSIAPVHLTTDYGIMARQEEGSALRPDADPAPYEHRFYRATLQGLFSLNIGDVGTFYYRNKTGFKNLDEIRVELAKAEGLKHLDTEKAYQLSSDKRLARIKWLLGGLGQLEGGAKLTIHYTDVSPSVVVLAVTKGGNHIFKHVVAATERGEPNVNLAALQEALQVHRNEILSDVYIGWVQGYLDHERKRLEAFIQNWAKDTDSPVIQLLHPRKAFSTLAQAFDAHPEWLG